MAAKNEIGIVGLKGLYGGKDWIPETLGAEYLKEIQVKRGERRRWAIVHPLPTMEEFKKLLSDKFAQTITDAITEAYSDIEELGGEMRSWYDNMPESLQGGDKGSMVDECANALESESAPDVDEVLQQLSVLYIPRQDSDSRADRLANAISLLEEVKSVLENLDTDDEPDEEAEAADEREEQAADKQETVANARAFGGSADELISSLDSTIGNLDGLEFPSMFG